MAHYSQHMLSEYTRETALRLAQTPELPLRFVGLTHSMTGSPEQALEFAGTVTNLRLGVLAARGLPLGADDPRFNLQASVEDGYHSDLLRPRLATKHLKETFALPLLTL